MTEGLEVRVGRGGKLFRNLYCNHPSLLRQFESFRSKFRAEIPARVSIAPAVRWSVTQAKRAIRLRAANQENYGGTVKIDSWLAELKIPRQAYRVGSLLPLVYVAWADGKIQREERNLILKIAATLDIRNAKGWQSLAS
ncbi:MAG: hypothetical protein MUO39_12030 [Steroidobacteraceae bacterium]|nr:hypothetical protein [Steroidobacteraceae bacterium]